ncbi:ABC transporter substrate-binding protein [Microbacterium sp. CPCC 204701]|uniref:ABC transporter substrate-binding protein n=1 Tax=Microbacterium sp. CPCC 204701 TaxID=2493084 RepID=UPI000FD86A08|nr:ABC transporter substrate-binding protein [Microbacterium sp. CPCC 204701]
MTKMSRRALPGLSLALGLSAALALAGCAGDGTTGGDGDADGKPVIRIGMTSTLSGAGADFGNNQQVGAMQAIDDYNADPDSEFTAELISYDDKFDPEQVVNNVTRLINSDKVVALTGGTSTGGCQRMAPQVNQFQVPTITTVCGGGDITGTVDAADDYMFRASMSDRSQSRFTLNWIKDQGWSKIAIIHNNDAYGTSGADAVEANAEDLGGIEIVCREGFNTGDTDLTAQLSKCRDANPDVIYQQAHANDVSLMLKSMQQIGWDEPVAGPWSIMGPEFTETAGELGVGAYVPNAFTVDTTDFSAAFDEAMRAEHGDKYTLPPVAAFSYDAVRSILAAAEKVDGDGVPTPQDIQKALTELEDGDVPYVTSAKPYTADNHEALDETAIFMTQYDDDLVLVPVD